jgi:type IV pilus assembly protein PilQ
MRTLPIAILVALTGHAAADRDLCASGTKFRGAPVDLDVKAADIRDVFRLLADVGKVNYVITEAVVGKVTLRLKRAPWDQIACEVAKTHKLKIMVQGNILMIDVADRPAGQR